MITVGMNYKVLPGKEDAFKNMFRAVLKVMGDMPGHTRSTLCVEVDDPTSFVILSDWSDKGAFEGFIASDQFRKVANWGKEKVLAARPSHEYYARD